MLVRLLGLGFCLLAVSACGILGGAKSSAKQNRVFVTSAVYNGNLGGLDGADLKCELAATTAGVSGTWKAWLSSAGIDPSGRFVLVYPIQDLHGLVVFPDAASLNGLLANPPQLDERGRSVSGPVWTNTDATGRELTIGCNNWLTASSSFTGITGSSTMQANGAWTQQGSASCDSMNHLYCFEQ